MLDFVTFSFLLILYFENFPSNMDPSYISETQLLCFMQTTVMEAVKMPDAAIAEQGVSSKLGDHLLNRALYKAIAYISLKRQCICRSRKIMCKAKARQVE